ncbi:MAG: TolC family protein [Terracidiphilus sp.]|nr:TolC family protein [Terracidiphilus sp.]
MRTCMAGMALAAACATVRAQQATPALTLAEAEHLAIEHNPRINIARLLQLAQAQVVREVRSSELPSAAANLTAVDSRNGSRITAGGLNNPIVYERAAGGITVSQLITDFGRTHNLVLSAQSQAKAQVEAQRATTADIVLAVDQAFYNALASQAVLKVAEQTVAARQATADQIGALAASKLKSSLDLSFANVEFSQAKLLLLDAQNAEQDSMANLNALLGSEQDERYTLVDETPTNAQPGPENIESLVQMAFSSRPDLASLNESYAAANRFRAAEHALSRPTVSALGTAGGTPVRADQIDSSWYGAVGANVSIPIFNGFLYSARAREADLRATAAQEEVRNLRETIARDVRTSALAAQAAFHRIEVTRQLLDESNLALDLAETRYKLGLSGIVELSQAQLAQTQAEIAYANARYAYQTALAAVSFQTGQ